MNLLPCPFCGGEAQLMDWKTHTIICRKCLSQVSAYTGKEQDTIDLWNRRTPIKETK